MPHPHTKPADGTSGRGKLERVSGPRRGILDPAILAQRAIHPGEWHFVDRDRFLGRVVPSLHDVGDAEPEPVPVRKAVRRVIAEAGARDRVLADAGPNAHAILSTAA